MKKQMIRMQGFPPEVLAVAGDLTVGEVNTALSLASEGGNFHKQLTASLARNEDTPLIQTLKLLIANHARYGMTDTLRDCLLID